MAEYIYEAGEPHEDAELGLLRPGDIREFGDDPGRPWTEIHEKAPESDSPPSGTQPPAPEPENPPAAASAPPATTPAATAASTEGM